MHIQDLYNSQYKQIAYNIVNPKSLAKDLHQEAILIICEKQIDISSIPSSQELGYYFAKIAWLTFKSHTFRKKYKLNKQEYLSINKIDVEDKGDISLEYVYEKEKEIIYLEQTLLKKPNSEDEKYKKNLLSYYIKYGSSMVSTITGISKRTICRDIAEYKLELKKGYENSNK